MDAFELVEHSVPGQAAVLTGCGLHRDPCSAVVYACTSGKVQAGKLGCHSAVLQNNQQLWTSNSTAQGTR